MISHMDECMETENIVEKQQFSCPYCTHECCSKYEVVSHMDNSSEDEDSVEEENYKFPSSSKDKDQSRRCDQAVITLFYKKIYFM